MEARGWRRAGPAQYNLGLAYARGVVVDRDDRSAREWFEKAAAYGHTGARFALDVIYAYGQGVERDVAKAVRWFQQAAQDGMPEAQYNLTALTKGEQARPPQETQESRRRASRPAVAQATADGIKAESWMLAREPFLFTIQLATATDEGTRSQVLASG